MNWIICSILYNLPLKCISGHPTSHFFFFSKFQFPERKCLQRIFFIAVKICQAGWFIWRASTNLQLWQLFLQATSQVMTAHNLSAPSHSAVLPFGFILKLIPEANFAVHYCILSLCDKMIITFCQRTIGWGRLGSIGFRLDFVLKSLILSATKYFRFKYQPCPLFHLRPSVSHAFWGKKWIVLGHN